MWTAPVLPLESQDSMSVVNVEGVAAGKPRAVGEAATDDVCSEATSGWTRSLVRETPLQIILFRKKCTMNGSLMDQ